MMARSVEQPACVGQASTEAVLSVLLRVSCFTMVLVPDFLSAAVIFDL